MTMTTQQFYDLSPGEVVHDQSVGGRWTIQEGQTVSNGDSITLSFDDFLAEGNVLNLAATPRYVAGHWYHTGTPESWLYYLHADPADDGSMELSAFLTEDGTTWHWYSLQTYTHDDHTFHPVEGTSPVNRRQVNVASVIHENQQQMQRLSEEVTQRRAEAADAVRALEEAQTAAHRATIINTAQLNEALNEWMENTNNQGDSGLRQIMTDHHMSPPSITETVTVRVSFSGTLERTLESASLNTAMGVALPWDDYPEVEADWSFSATTTVEVLEGSCACDSLTNEDYERMIRDAGHGVLVDDDLGWEVSETTCDNC